MKIPGADDLLTLRPTILLIIIGFVAACNAVAQVSSPQILVAPNVLVSQGEYYRHHESMLAANPLDAKMLVATSITAAWTTKTYSSADGGLSWTPNSFADQLDPDLEFGGGDPQVAFGPKGTAYFLHIARLLDKQGKRGDAFLFYRSENGGKHWERAIQLPICDHPQLIVDKSNGEYHGNIYISALIVTKGEKHTVQVYRSDDDGHSFADPVVAVEAREGINSTTPIVLSDGTLVVPFVEFALPYSGIRNFGFVTSSDGGRSFSQPQAVGVQRTFPGHQAEHEKFLANSGAAPKLGYLFDWPMPAMFAADSHSTDSRRDRLYAVWADTPTLGRSRVLFSYSADRGKSWIQPRQISPDVPPSAHQYQPALAVNNHGVVGIEWFDTRNSPTQDSYDLYFTASVDGGESFLPVKRITSESSFPAVPGNLRPDFTYGSDDGSLDEEMQSLSLFNAYHGHSNGGDYMLFDSDPSGAFHPFWVDIRTGTSQLWTTKIRVESVPLSPRSGVRQPAPVNVTKDLIILCGPIEFDSVTNQALIYIRLKNISDHFVIPPISVVVKTLAWTYSDEKPSSSLPSPLLLNSTNGKSGEGAVIDYSRGLRDLDSLAPGESTEPLQWRLQLDRFVSTVSLKVQVKASTF